MAELALILLRGLQALLHPSVFAAAILVLLAGTSPAVLGQPMPGGISGLVGDSSIGSVRQTQIIALRTESGTTPSVAATAEGDYPLLPVEPGRHDIKVEVCSLDPTLAASIKPIARRQLQIAAQTVTSRLWKGHA